MDDRYQQAVRVATDLRQLAVMHERLIAELYISVERTPDFGYLSASPSAISCTCHSHKLTATPRPVAIDGRVAALEYEFLALWKDAEIPILRLYLQSNGALTLDAKGSVMFHNVDDKHIKNHILVELSEALLRSPIFTPRES
jgi:hypothetical protein